MEPTILLLLRVNSPLFSDGGRSGHVIPDERYMYIEVESL